LPGIRITDLLLEVDDGIGFNKAFTHLRTGVPCAGMIGPLNLPLDQHVEDSPGRDLDRDGQVAHSDACRPFPDDLSAWLDLTPEPHSSGGKKRLGAISKIGNRYARRPIGAAIRDPDLEGLLPAAQG
jgi:transposase